MLSYINIVNFKSIGKVELDLGRINVFIGANRSGKSTIAHAMCLLKQSNGGLQWDGPYIKLGSFENAVKKNSRPKILGLRVGGVLSASNELTTIIRGSEITFGLHIASAGPITEIDVSLGGGPQGFNQEIISGTITSRGNQVVKELHVGKFSFTVSGKLDPHYPLHITGHSATTDSDRNQYEITLNAIEELIRSFGRQFNLFSFIPVTRGFDRPSYVMYDGPPADAMTSEGTTRQAESLANQIAYSNRKIEDRVNELLRKVIPGVEIRQYPAANKNIAIVSKDETGEYNIIHEGFGLNQLAFLFSQLVATEPNATLFIEEPEISLHPSLQMSVCSILVEAALKESKQLVITTHSEHILLGILESVMEKKIDPDAIRVYHFERDDHGDTKVTKLKVNSLGELEGGLKGFFEVDMQHIEKFFERLRKEKEK